MEPLLAYGLHQSVPAMLRAFPSDGVGFRVSGLGFIGFRVSGLERLHNLLGVPQELDRNDSEPR